MCSRRPRMLQCIKAIIQPHVRQIRHSPIISSRTNLMREAIPLPQYLYQVRWCLPIVRLPHCPPSLVELVDTTSLPSIAFHTLYTYKTYQASSDTSGTAPALMSA